MIVFMVKWAVASIPALLILVVLGGVFWSVVVGALFLPSYRSGSSAQTTATAGSEGQSAVEANYISQILVKNVATRENYDGTWGYSGEIKNVGDHALTEVDITVYLLGNDGKPVFEQTNSPVRSGSMYMEISSPLKPGYSRKFDYTFDKAPSDWGKKVNVKVSLVKFQ